jgi:thiol-disulfide isomerase/thioredoxin
MVRFLFALLSLALVSAMGCAPTSSGGDGSGDPVLEPTADEDGDLLTNGFELEIGTDPTNADTDGDGFDDGLEYAAYFKPWDENDYPYTGGYARGPTPPGSRWDEITADDGWGLGDVSRSWTMTDRHGEELRLKRFFGQVIMIDISAEWCPPCRDAASTLEEEWHDRVDDGFTVIQLMLDGMNPGDGAPNLDRWANDFGLTIPVLDDGQRETTNHYVPTDEAWGIPMFAQINRDFVIAQWNRSGSPAPWGETDQYMAEDFTYADEVDEWWPLPENNDAIRDDLGFSDSMYRGYVEAM